MIFKVLLNSLSECLVTDDKATKTRVRKCFKDEIEVDNDKCYGNSEQTVSCPYFTQWTDWQGLGKTLKFSKFSFFLSLTKLLFCFS